MSQFGADKLIAELTELKYKPEKMKGADGNTYVVFSEYEIVAGKFIGKIIALGLLEAVDYPNSVHSSIHVKAMPQLYETTDSVPNVRNIQNSGIGSEWRYWSKNFNWAAESRKDARRLMAKINTIFEHA